MMHRGIITPRAIIEHSLGERAAQSCDSLAVWSVTNSVAKKSLERYTAVRTEFAVAKKLGNMEEIPKCRQVMDEAVRETAELFTLIFAGLVRNHQDFEDKDLLFRHVTVQRVLAIGRKYS